MKQNKYHIHPDFRILSLIHPPLHRRGIPVIQRIMRLFNYLQRSDRDIMVERVRFVSDEGNTVSALLYVPEKVKTKGCLVYFHGGGYAFPAAQYQYRLARIYAKAVGCTVLFPDYRLTPKYPYPAAAEDCFAAYKWMRSHVPDAPVAVCGDSAGGTLSMAICLMAHDRGIPVPCAQLLTYPYVGHCGETESMRLYKDAPMLTRQDMTIYDKWYVPEPDAGNPAYWSPIESGEFDVFPMTYIETAENDILRDGAVLFAKELYRKGIRVELNNTKGTVHGYDIMLRSEVVRRQVARRIRFLKKALPSE